MQLYDDPSLFRAYSQMDRSKYGLSAAGEWHQLQKLIPDVSGKAVLDIGCGYGWHSRYCLEQGAAYVLGIDASAKMIAEAEKRSRGLDIGYRVCALEDFDYPCEFYDFIF